MNYGELYNAIQSYTENQFPVTYMADGTTVSSAEQINRLIEQAEQRIYNSVQFPSLRRNVVGSVSSANPYLSCPGDFLATYSLAVIDPVNGYEYLLNKDVNFIRQAYPKPTDTGFPKYYALFGSATSDSNELTFILGPTPDAVYSAELHYYYYPATIAKTGSVTGTLVPEVISANYVNGIFPVSTFNGSGTGLGVFVYITGLTPAISSITVYEGGSGYKVGDVITIALDNLTNGVDQGYVSATITSVAPDFTNTTWLGDNFDTVLLYGCLVEAYTYMKGEQDLITLYDTKYKEALSLAKRLGDGMERQDAYRSGQVRIQVT